MVIGAGGGARAVCYALQHTGATDIRVVNRTRENAERLARDMGRRSQSIPGRKGTSCSTD